MRETAVGMDWQEPLGVASGSGSLGTGAQAYNALAPTIVALPKDTCATVHRPYVPQLEYFMLPGEDHYAITHQCGDWI
jgi:hypothetical protein